MKEMTVVDIPHTSISSNPKVENRGSCQLENALFIKGTIVISTLKLMTSTFFRESCQIYFSLPKIFFIKMNAMPSPTPTLLAIHST